MPLLTRFIESMRTLGCLETGTSFLVAASGGLDSTVLVHLCCELRNAWDIRVAVASVHHGLRPEADGEIQFVRELADALHLPFSSRSLALKEHEGGKESTQSRARRLRYHALEEMRLELNCEWILTAHHADDQAETLVMHFLRGQGPGSLAGVRAKKGVIRRPLLFARKNELLSYARERGLAWMEDPSNDKDIYLRNAIRHHVMPALELYVNPSLVETLTTTAALYHSLEEYLSKSTVELERTCVTDEGDRVSLAVLPLKGYFEFQRFLLIRRVFSTYFDQQISLQETTHIDTFLLSERYTSLQFRDAVLLTKTPSRIELFSISSTEIIPQSIAIGQAVNTGNGIFESATVERSDVVFLSDPTIEFIDMNVCTQPLHVRRWMDGDTFFPFGLSGRKKLSDFFIDSHIPEPLRKQIPIIVSGDRIVWVCGMRLDDRFKVTETTRDVVRLAYTPTRTTL